VTVAPVCMAGNPVRTGLWGTAGRYRRTEVISGDIDIRGESRAGTRKLVTLPDLASVQADCPVDALALKLGLINR
jgi:hypothetical protein